VGIFVASKNSGNGGSGSSNNGAQPSSHTSGQGSTGVTFTEYGDYECPVCAEYNPVVDQVEQQFTKQITYQFRNLPLTQIHPNAFAAARAAEAAGLQNKYFDMHNKLYANQNQWASASDPKSFFDTYAKAIGLNISQFDTDYLSSKVNDVINADLAAFAKTGQQMATPTFFLDGTYIDNSKLIDSTTGQPSVSKFASLINAEIAKKQAK